MTILDDLDFMVEGKFPSKKVADIFAWFSDGDVINRLHGEGFDNEAISNYLECVSALRRICVPSQRAQL